MLETYYPLQFSEKKKKKEVGIIYMGSMENTIQEIDDIIEETFSK